MPPRSERRLKRRHTLEDVQGSLLFAFECRILNLSSTGVAVESAAPLAPGRSYTLRVDHEGRQIPIAGIVAWCRLQGTRRNAAGDSVPLYAAGLELGEDMSGKVLEVLPILEQQGVVQLERRLAGHLVPHGNGEQAAPALVVVRRLSRSGLVADAPFLPEKGDLLDLWIGLEEGNGMALTGRVRQTRKASPRDGEPWTELTVDYVDPSPADCARLDRLIRDELLEISPPKPAT
ncbi:MAG TPA: PilZ domain-containing protein [Thermoanaerobaculia bacterium]|nr:PilZ domain-containing protein [Thermoanaerobaculia bacterium]